MKPLALRTKDMDLSYRAERLNKPLDHDPFEEKIKKESLRVWDHWALLENKYPYDAVAEIHHLLVANRKFGRIEEMMLEEKAELESIKLELKKDYDSFIENFPRNKSVPGRLHFHLVVWKGREE